MVLIKKVKLEKEKVIKNQRIAGGLIIFLSVIMACRLIIGEASLQVEFGLLMKALAEFTQRPQTETLRIQSVLAGLV